MGEESGRRCYKKSAVTRQAIFDAAMKLMKEKGYQGTTIREICAEAGTAVGSFYSYYGGKTDILKALYADGEEYFDTVVRADTGGPDALENIRIFFRHYARLNIRTGVETLRVMFTPDNEWFGRKKMLQQVLEEIICRGQDGGQLRADLEALRLVDDLFLYMRGVCYDWCSRGGAYDLEQRMVECLALVLSGLVPEETTENEA